MQRGHHLFMNMTLQHAGGEISVSSSNSCQIFCSEAVTVSSLCYPHLEFIHQIQNYTIVLSQLSHICKELQIIVNKMQNNAQLHSSFFFSFCQLRCKTVKEKILLSKENKMSCVNAESRKMGKSKEMKRLIRVKISIYFFCRSVQVNWWCTQVCVEVPVQNISMVSDCRDRYHTRVY